MTSHHDETTSERIAHVLNNVLFGKVAYAVLAIVLLIAAVLYLVR